MHSNNVLLSAVLTVGAQRERAGRVLDALSSQTVVDSIEIVVVDLSSEDTPRLKSSSGVPISYLKLPRTEPFGRARAEGARRAKAPVVAFIEDHCTPAPDWAEVLIEAHKGPWAAVGYAFTNANPVNYVSQACFIADYGLWAHPARHGPTDLLPGNNASYKRDALLSLGEKLDAALSADFNIHETFKKRGLQMLLESRAIGAHENYTDLSDLLRANYTYCRVLASTRVRTQSWGRLRRIAYGLGVLPGAPLIKLVRLFRSFYGRRPLWPALAATLPVTLLTYIYSAVGESLGYMFGEGSAGEEFKQWEIESERGKVV